MDKSKFEVKKFGLTDNINGEKTLDLSLKINTKAYDWLKDIAMIKPQFVPETMQPCCTEIRNLCDTCRKVLVCPMMQTSMREKCELYEKLPNPLDEIVTETRSLNPIKEEKSMESAERIEITFKSGETISYGKGEWDDYAYDGKAVIVKKNSAWIGIYNFDDVFCVELK